MALIEEARRRCGAALSPDVPVLAFAWRMTGYKRADLLFTDLEKLRAIVAKHPFQIVVAGKAHPQDGKGKASIRAILDHGRWTVRCRSPSCPSTTWYSRIVHA